MSRPKKYRTFTKDFKGEAVKFCLESGKTIKQVAEDLGIPVESPEHCGRQHACQGDDAFRGNGHRTAVQMELCLVRKEVAEFKMERDILRKRRPGSRSSIAEVCLHEGASKSLAAPGDVPGSDGLPQRLLRLAGSPPPM